MIRRPALPRAPATVRVDLPEAPSRDVGELGAVLRAELGPCWPEAGWRWAGVGCGRDGWYVLVAGDLSEDELDDAVAALVGHG